MSRSGNKKPVGFATHVTAGGIAGACEAVSATPVFQARVLILSFS
jgi:solute carrier family 25 citrate transporter 1